MKKMINRPDDVVEELLQGMTSAHPEYVRHVAGYHALVRAEGSQGKVALVGGGGSGHEPAYGGYVGKGMLDGAAAGAIFTSPTPDQVYETVKACDGGKGVLLIVNNYTGEVNNFQMAAEMARSEGIEVEQVIVNDDVAVENSTWTTGRRGMAGIIFVYKIAGACAQTGANLAKVKAVAEQVIANVRTIGVTLSPCTVPAAGKPGFHLGEQEVEIGMGIHGEPGICRENIRTVNETTDTMLQKIFVKGLFRKGDEAAVMVNGMGATPLQELYLASRRVCQVLTEKKIRIAKTLVGNYLTSIDMEGYSVTLMKLDEELKRYLLAPADTPAYVQA